MKVSIAKVSRALYLLNRWGSAFLRQTKRQTKRHTVAVCHALHPKPNRAGPRICRGGARF